MKKTGVVFMIISLVALLFGFTNIRESKVERNVKLEIKANQMIITSADVHDYSNIPLKDLKIKTKEKRALAEHTEELYKKYNMLGEKRKRLMSIGFIFGIIGMAMGNVLRERGAANEKSGVSHMLLFQDKL